MEERNIIQNRLFEYLERTGRTQVAVARSIGVSKSVISQWLNDVYPGDNAKLEKSVVSFLEKEAEREKSPTTKLKFVHTTASRRLFEVANICLWDGEIGVCTANAGYGKTWAVRQFAERVPSTILIEVDPGVTVRVLISELHRSLGIGGGGVFSAMLADVIGRLKETGRLLIVDEAECLPHRALESLRRIHDKAGVGILLVGLPRLIANLRGSRGEFAQLFSRVGVHAALGPATEEDYTAILAEVRPDAAHLAKNFHHATMGRLRLLEKLLRRAVRLAEMQDEALSPDIITAAKDYLIY